MDFLNQSGFPAAWTQGLQVDGRERLVIIVKATYTIPRDGATPRLAEAQLPLVTADEYWGEPGLSAPKVETDYAHYKPWCDVIVNGTAYAPGGRAVRRLNVSLRAATTTKSFAVVGERAWRRIPLLGVWPGTPEPFTAMPISYDRAFGGVDTSRGEDKIQSFVANPVGRGFRRYLKGVEGQPLPNTEEAGNEIRSPRRHYRPMSFGPIGRNWQPRAKLAGTYDEQWLETRVPLFPEDFDERYFQAAPADQQMAYPRGGERIELVNLSPGGFIGFDLPADLSMPVLVARVEGPEETLEANVDTIVIEPDAGLFALTWRAVLPLRRNCFELYEIIVGRLTPAERRERRAGDKNYFASFADLVAARSSQP